MRKKLIPSIVVFLLSYLILFIFLGSNIFGPNDYVYAFGGDASFIYYNMSFHTLYGDGWTLENMNYPKYESLLMTDAQAGISYVLSHLSRWSGNDWIQRHVIGITHSLHYFFLALASVFSYLSLRKINIVPVLAIIFGLLIVFMSPQIIRLRFGHFGLAYPVIFTFATYIILCLKDKWSLILPAMLGLVLLFFGINNIYLLILGSGFVMCYVVLDVIFYSRSRRNLALIVAAMIPLIIVFGLIEYSSLDSDRIRIQWGYFENRTRIKDLFYPFTSLIGTLMKLPKARIESANNLGLINVVVLGYGVIYLLYKRQRLSAYKMDGTEKKLLCLLGAGLLMFLYSSGMFDFTKDVLPLATMFKASGRFAWPLYYATSICSVYMMQKIWKTYSVSIWAKSIVIGAILLWSYETYNYLDRHVKFSQHGSQYTVEMLEKLRAKLIDAHIDIEGYQAIYTLPMMVGWNDKFMIQTNWFAEMSSIKMSLATGLPMINGMLSRLSVSDAGRIVNLASHPLIEKDLSLIDTTKAILLLLGRDADNLTEGERYMVDNSKQIFSDKHFTLFRLDPRVLNRYRKEKISYLDTISYENPGDHYYQDFDNKNVDALFGNGALLVDKDQRITELSTGGWQDTLYEISIYTKMNAHKTGMPNVKIEQVTKGRSTTQTDIAYGVMSKNMDGPWRRISKNFNLKKDTDKLIISLERINQPFVMDELLIRSVIDTIIYTSPKDSDLTMFNNYLLVKRTD